MTTLLQTSIAGSTRCPRSWDLGTSESIEEEGNHIAPVRPVENVPIWKEVLCLDSIAIITPTVLRMGIGQKGIF